MFIKKGDRVEVIDKRRPSDPPVGATGTAIEDSGVPYVNWDAQYPIGKPCLGYPNIYPIIDGQVKVLPIIETQPAVKSMNKQNFIVQIIIAIVGVFLRQKSVQAHISGATSLFDGVIAKIDKSVDVLYTEADAHQAEINLLKAKVGSARVLADQKLDAAQKLSALRNRVTDITG